jgi:hypothetical protein
MTRDPVPLTNDVFAFKWHVIVRGTGIKGSTISVGGRICIVTRPSRLRVTAPSRCRAGKLYLDGLKLYHYPNLHPLRRPVDRQKYVCEHGPFLL